MFGIDRFGVGAKHTTKPALLRLTAVVAVFALVATACWGDDDDAAPADDPGPVTGQVADDEVRILLSQGRAAAAEPVAVVEGEPLTAERVAEIVARLADLPVDDADRQDFNRPAESLPPPVAGTTVDVPFGPASDDPAPEVDDGPLQVLRVQPEGAVDVAPFVTVTFDQPMVPLTTLDQLDAADVPMTIEPELPGRWRWLGTRTLRFEHASDEIDRLPMATEYEVTIPAGTTSMTGGRLAEAESFTFSTPAPTVLSLAPRGDSMPTRPVFVAVFDQQVDPATVVASVELRAGNDRRSVRVATAEEVAADEDASRVLARAETPDGERSGLDGRVVAFVAEQALPTDTDVSVAFGPGTPSAEGPLVTEDAQTFRGRTFGPFEVDRAECGYGDGCRPGVPFRFELSNPVDPATFDPAAVEIEPAVNASIGAFGSVVEVYADTSGNTTYEVTLPAELRDVFGQTLGEDTTRSFDVGDARDQLTWYGQDVVTVDPFAPTPALSVQVVNHDELRVRAHVVDPGDWTAFERLRDSVYDDDLATPPGQLAMEETVDTGAERGTRTEVEIDLADAFEASDGQLVVVVEPTTTYSDEEEAYYENRPVVAWVQRTDIGVDAIADDDELVVWATGLRDGEPIAGATVSFGSQTATTGRDGLARLELGSTRVPQLTVSVGDDTALLRSNEGGWERYDVDDEVRWQVFDDRGLYRPGETVRVKGYVRRLVRDDSIRIERLADGAEVTWLGYDSFGNEIGSGDVAIDDAGGFDLAFDLPAGSNLGNGWLELQLAGVSGLEGASTGHAFGIQEFRRPDFEVNARSESAEPHLFTRPVTAAATASYFAGGDLSDAEVTWQVSSRSTSYSPPNWPDFTFGIWEPWWYIDDIGVDYGRGAYESDVVGPPFGPEDSDIERFSGRTDASGTHYLRLDFTGATPDRPLMVSANAAVTDVNRQTLASTVDLLVHSGTRYVGLGGDQTFVREGEPLRIDAVLTDIDGNPVAGEPFVVSAARLEQRWEQGRWTEVEVDRQECEVVSEAEPVECTFATDVGGQYRIASTVTDADGGQNRSELTRWVAGGDAVPRRSVEQERATLVPDSPEHAPGDTAEILVQAPFSPATGLLTVTQAGIVSTEVFAVEDGSAVVSIPITDRSIPGVDVQVDLVGTAPRTLDDGTDTATSDDGADLPPRPAFATGRIAIDVPPRQRTLTVAPTPRAAALEPGADTVVDLAVTDATGAPVAGASATVVVVDEAVLSLTGYRLGDPIDTFYAAVNTYLRTSYGRSSIVLARPETLGVDGAPSTTIAPDAAGRGAATGGDDATDDSGDGADFDVEESAAPLAEQDGEGGSGAEAPIAERTDFDPLAVFAPEVTTGPDGTASVEVPLPDNLTRYRVMAVAVAGDDRFGAGEATITARLPLSVRPTAPRFLNFGDTFELPVIVQNQTGEDLQAEVVLEATNLGLDATGVGRFVTVPANDRIEVRFPVTADDAGTARYRVTSVSGGLADSATGELPVYTPTTSEAFATYGVIDDGAVAQPLATPTGVVPQFGGLEVTTSSTSLQALTDAVLYLVDYDYDSSDALASRIMAIAALRDVFDAFDVQGVPGPSELDGVVRDDIERLVALQNDDGGWAVWRRYRGSVPYHSIQATHSLVIARAADYEVPSDAIDRALEYLRTIEDRYPSDYSQQTRNTLSAYALHVRDLAGDDDPGKALRLYRDAGPDDGRDDGLGLDAVAWLWPVIDDADAAAEIERLFGNRVTETAGAATFTTDVREDAHLVLASDRRTDGIVLDALIRVRPGSDLIPKVVQGLIGNQRQGRWDNVQENSFILLALKRYFDTFEDQTPDFVARAWLGDQQTVAHEFRGRSTESQRSVVPMSELVARDDPDLVVSKTGPGRLYYRLGLRYAPADLSLDPRDEGFVVERTYEAVEDPDDVTRDADGTWRIAAGAEVRVRVTMVADSRRVNMALVDPLPAGLEIVNGALANAPATLPEENGLPDENDGFDEDLGGGFGGDWYWPWWGTWHDHENLRDDRAEAFAAWLPAGTYDYSYVARATTPGTFVVPPAKAEEIYAPEVFGRSSTDRLVVEP